MVSVSVNPMKYAGCTLTLPALALTFGVASSWGAALNAAGVPNFHQVNENIYRGAQPTNEGWQSLAKLGIKVVVDLRREGEDGEHTVAAEKKAVEAAGMRFVHVPMKG